MHRKPEAKLLPLDIEIEKTMKNLRRITNAESRNMTNQRERLQSILEEEEEVERLQKLILWRTFRDLLFKRSTLQ